MNSPYIYCGIRHTTDNDSYFVNHQSSGVWAIWRATERCACAELLRTRFLGLSATREDIIKAIKQMEASN